MIITDLFIRNFRCYGPKQEKIKLKNFTAFVGANSSGKSASLQALLRMFGQNTRDRLLTRNDFHVPVEATRAEMDNDKELSIEVKIEFPELSNTDSGQNTIPSFFNYMVIQEPNMAPYIRIRLRGQWTKGASINGEIDQYLEYIRVPFGEDEKDACLPVPSHERSLIQMIYVPAIREPAEQLKTASGSILYRLLNNIKWPEDFDTLLGEETLNIDSLFNDIDGFRIIKNEISTEWSKFHNDQRYKNANIGFLNTSIESILKRIEIQFSPTEEPHHHSVERLGEGLRSLFYISLVSSILSTEEKINKNPDVFQNKNSTALTILAVEEPENHISPHLLGTIMKNLREIASKNNAQTLLTSHSASIIKRVEPEEIKHVRINNRGETIVSSIFTPDKLSEELKYVKEAIKAYPELYFSRLVILGEGDSEEIILDKLLEVEGLWADSSSVSVVPLGGRHVNHFWKLLNQLAIPHITLLDLDLGRTGGGWGRIKYALQQLLLNINEPAKSKLLLLEDGETLLSQDHLENMHLNPLHQREEMEFWISRLKEYNVFFSKPLDIDFLMLEYFPDIYKNLTRIDDEDMDEITIQKGIAATLKKKEYSNALGEDSYSRLQLELMPYYKTLFLGRGKPTTHIEALSKMDVENIKTNYPHALKELLSAIKEELLKVN
ncbi:ATP-dependent nuclease [Priestia megaterium]|uniref:ATP-dependent nuclease n=1 Tax=Priestia megaterium TaxID=1404 RepID=UPI00345AA17A